MRKDLADTDIHIFEENMSMIVVLHVYVPSYNHLLHEIYDTIILLDQLRLPVW